MELHVSNLRCFHVVAVAIASGFLGCSAPPRFEAPPFDLASLGAQVSEDRDIPERYVPIGELDAPPPIRSSAIVDRFEDEIEHALHATGMQEVEIVLLVNEAGTVDDVIIRKAQYAYFAERARSEARRLRFSPAYRKGLPAKWYATQMIRFTGPEEEKAANQALQTTSVTRSGFGKVSVSDRQRRGV